MPYDEQGNFYGSNEDLGELKAKYVKPDPVSQIPGQVSSSKPEESKSLRDRAVSALMQYNPLMLRKSLGEASAAVLGGMALPVVAPISAGVQALNALPGNLLRRYNGEEEVKTPSAEDLMRKYGEAIAPKTPLGQEMVGGVGKLMDTLKVPAAWPMAPSGPKRPVLTPTDVRVGAGQIKQLAKELKETPRDFQAAQSGLKRQNLYGEDTIGVKAQAAADSLGNTLERRRAADLSPIPGVPGVLTPETSMYAVRPKGSRLVQPKVPESAKNYTPEFSSIADFVDDVYGNVEAKDIPPTMLINEYGSRFLNNEAGREFKQALMDFDKQKALEMFPDAPSPTLAQRAYELLYSDRDARAAKSIETIEEFLALPENQRFVEAGFPTPSQFLDRYKEAERVVKGPLVNYISKNVGAEDDPTVKLARQGITYETPGRIQELERYVRPDVLAQVRTAGGFPAMGSFHEERMAKTGELDKLNEEIAALEDLRAPLFNRAHEEGIDPAAIPEYAETTNPLRQKMRQREQLQGELENIKLATSVENLSDYSVTPRTKKQMEMDIPYQERQFFPSVIKGGENEAFYVLSNKSLLEDLGYKKLGIDLMEDILNGTAGDTSKLTVEKYIRDKHLTRVEAEKAAKLQQQQYRKNLEGVLLKRLQEDPNVQTFGNAAIITLNKDTPKDVALRDMSTDTAILDHCVGQGGSAPAGRRNPVTNREQNYEPIIDPVSGERSKNIRDDAYSAYVDSLERGDELVSVRDAKTGLPAATLQLLTTGDPGKFWIGYASGAKNGAIEPEYVDALKQYLNSRGEAITSAGEHLSDNAGIFDLGNPRGRDQAIRAAGIPGYNQAQRASELSRTLELAVQNLPELPRFVTSDDVKKMFEQIAPQTQVAPVQAARPTGAMELRDYDSFVEEFQNALEAAAESAMENSNLENPNRVEGAMGRAVATIFDAHLNDPVEFVQEPVTRLRRVERDLRNVIDSAYAQQNVVDSEMANGLEDFLIDVRGLRASLERRLNAAEQAAVPANRPQGVVAEGSPIPPIDVTDLINMFGDRLTRPQLNWLQNFIQRWDNDVDTSPAGQGIEQEMILEYDRWRAENRLQPVEGEAVDLGAAPDLGNWEVDETHPANQPAPRVQVQDPVPREIQTLAPQDLILRLGPDGVSEARRIATEYFNANIFNDDTPVSAATNAIRSYNFGVHEGQPPMVRELAARELEGLNSDAINDAHQIAQTIREAFYEDNEYPAEALHDVVRDMGILRQRGEDAWEDLIGPLAEDIPWNRNIQNRLLQELESIANDYRRQRDEGEGGQAADNRPRRGPFQPGGSSAVRGRPLGNLNIQPAIRAEALRGPDSQPVRNFLQQVRGLPGVTQEGLTTGLMAFENMDPNRRMTKAEFVRELLPSSYDIVDLRGTADDNVHYRDMAEQHVSEDPESVLNEMGISDRYHGEILDVINDDLAFEELSSGAKKALKKKNINDYDSLYSSHAEAFRSLVENGMEYLADMDGTQVADANGFRYANTQRLVLNSTGDEYSEFGVTHPDEQRTYHHFANAPDGLIGHVRGTYNPEGLEVKTTNADIFTTKRNSYVIEEIQSDAQKNSQQVGHLHQVHGVLFKAAIQRALESGADVVYLPTAKVIASERPGAGGHEPRINERTGLTTMVPIKKDTTNKFKPIYDQAIIKEGLKPLLKIKGVTSKLVSGGDYHEITFTPEAKEYILNGPGQTIPGYAKGGPVKKPMTPPVITRRSPELAEMQYRYGGMV